MNKYWVLVLAWAVLGCGGSDIELPDQVLHGTFDGEEWTYQSANGYFQPTLGYVIKFLSDDQPGAGTPCGVVSPSFNYLEMIIDPSVGATSYTLPLISPEKVSFRFPQSGKELLTTSGFLEFYVIDINAGLLRGYLQAVVDDDHSVEGAFEVRLCN